MVSNEQLKRIFNAYKAKDDDIFYKTAESIIAELAASNEQALALYIKNLINEYKGRDPKIRQLSVLPKSKIPLDSLVSIHDSYVDASKIILNNTISHKIHRVVEEQIKRSKLEEHGIKPKNKLLFWGPPGCGKTFTADYIAYELSLQVGIVKLSSLISSFLGDTASNIKQVFDYAKATPMVLLLDEIDAIGKNRDDKNDVGELKRVVNSLLQIMDDFPSRRSIIIACSNHQYLLDSALWRRFDDVIQFPRPSKQEIQKYLQKLLRNIKHKVVLPSIANLFLKMSYAEIKQVIDESVKTMLLSDKNCLTTSDITRELKAFKSDRSIAKNRIE